ncbi:alpha-amylase family protein [Mariniluteicoccus endophyticus]
MHDLDTAILAARRSALLDEVVRPLKGLYGDRPDFAEVVERLLATVEAAFAERPADLRALDERRLVTPDWFQREDIIGYVAYADRFAGSLKGVADRLDLLEQLGVSYLHLMPLLKPREGANDGGYAVADYREVDPRLGTMADLRELGATLRSKGMSLVVDLVCNHTAAEHPWAQAARAGDERYRDYYWFYADRDGVEGPDAWEKTLPEVFPDFAPGNFTWLDDAVNPDGTTGSWVWTTFNEWQWDLNYRNPEVLREMLEIVLFLANQGVEVVRLDAVAFMWKRLGTTCQNEPEAHLILQALRALTRIAAPGLVLLAEAIVSPDDLVPYFGTGRATGRECELAYHNVLMVTLWSALAEQNARLLGSVIRSMPEIPATSAWLTYARLHDDIGWAITDEDAARVGYDGFAHRAFLSDFYSGDFDGSWASGEVFQANPRTGDRRISGSLASLAGLERALLEPAGAGRDRLVDLAVRRIVLLHALVLSFGGVPLIYSGDEIGLLNDRSYLADPDLRDDNRWIHRPRMDWDAAARRFAPETVECRVFSALANLVEVRRRTPAFHASAPAVPVETGNDKVLGLLRRSPRGTVLVLANMSPEPFSIGLQSSAHFTPGSQLRDLVSGHPEERTVRMAAYQVRWMAEVPAAETPTSQTPVSDIP